MSEAAVGKKTAWAWAVGTFLGAGRLHPGPGTWGSAAATVLWLAVAMGLHLAPGPLAWLSLAAAMGALAIGIPAATRVIVPPSISGNRTAATRTRLCTPRSDRATNAVAAT